MTTATAPIPGTYTLTKTITDANGRQQQTTVTVDSSTASRTVTTTLIVKVEKSTQHGREDVKQDYTYPPETTLTDGAVNTYTLHIAELLADPAAQRSEDGKTITVAIKHMPADSAFSFNINGILTGETLEGSPVLAPLPDPPQPK